MLVLGIEAGSGHHSILKSAENTHQSYLIKSVDVTLEEPRAGPSPGYRSVSRWISLLSLDRAQLRQTLVAALLRYRYILSRVLFIFLKFTNVVMLVTSRSPGSPP